MGVLVLRFAIILLAVSCGTAKRQAVSSDKPLGDLLDKKQAYLDEFKFHQDKDGWIHTDGCDAALFSGLSAVFASGVSLLDARDSSGKWYRRPAKDCYPGHSGSSISRDMLAGIMFGLWATGDSSSLEDLRRYGKANNWIMGSGSLDRTYFTFNFQDTLYRLTGKTYGGPQYIWVDPIKDHQRHVVALNIILRGEAQGKIDKQMLSLLRTFTSLEPANALFQFGYHRFFDGDQSEVVRILRDENLFPYSGPGGSRCKRWLWERTSLNWQDCNEPEENTGGDFLFVMWLLERSTRPLSVVYEDHDSDRDGSSEHAKQTRTQFLLR